MSIHSEIKFKVMINGKQSGALGQWQHISLVINSCSDAGSDDEKFNVLAAIRRTYDRQNNSDIRGTKGQTPAQVGRCEGFRELSYQRITAESAKVFIVPPAIQHLRLVERSVFQNETDSESAAGH